MIINRRFHCTKGVADAHVRERRVDHGALTFQRSPSVTKILSPIKCSNALTIKSLFGKMPSASRMISRTASGSLNSTVERRE